MAEIHNLKELNELGRDLRLDDRIYFTTKNIIIKYTLYYNHLFVANYLNLENDFIFDYLNLNTQKTYELVKKCYGYESCSGLWPRYKENDFQAAERLIREIYKRLSDNSVDSSIKINNEELITNRFEILDL